MLRRGNCYVASEALYHILGGKTEGWKSMRLRINNETHWLFLKHTSGTIVDPSRQQFKGRRVLYDDAIGCGFLTKKPSRRATKLIKELTWQQT